MTTFNWQVTKLECYPESQSKTNMVFNVTWKCEGLDPVSGYKGEYYTSTYIPYNPDHHWIEYADLTEVEVLEWIYENGVVQADIEAAVQKQIDDQITPPVVAPALPWA